MRIKKFIVSLVILTFFNCNSQSKSEQKINMHDEITLEKNLNKIEKEELLIYEFHDEKFSFVVKIRRVSENEVFFHIQNIDHTTVKIVEKKGKAILRKNPLGNSELGVDENEEVFDVVPYDYINGDCYITLYIETYFGSRLGVVSSNECDDLINEMCKGLKCYTLRKVQPPFPKGL